MTHLRPPDLLPGRSALEEVEFGLKLRAAGIALVFAVLGAAAVFDGPPRVVVVWALAIPGIAAAILSTRAWYASMRAEKREREAGYTTEFDIAGKDLWQLDPKTGIVLRRPGEPLISRRTAQRLRRQR